MSIPPSPPAQTPAPPTEAKAQAPDTLGDYDLLLEIASGGMATVYLGRARDGRSGAKLVAIKRPHRHLAAEKNFLAMLLDEARLASAITHENVVKVRELCFHQGEPFIVMDYVEGASLSELRKELAASERAFDLRVALRIVLDALAGLHAAHELCDANGKPLGIVHRDISPHNVLVGSDGRSRLTDFGIAQATDRLQQTRTHEVKGKLAYLSPERIDRRRICTRQSDIFSMAVVLWECLAGRRLFRGEQAIDTLQEVMHAPIPRLRQIGREIPPALDDVIAKALSRDLEVRYQTALEFQTALERTAGLGAVGQPAQVARLIDALYGPRMMERHDQVRSVLKDDIATDSLFTDAGLPPRSQRTGPVAASALDAIRAFAPPAPSERYAFGEGQADFRFIDERRTRWTLIAGIAGGILVGIVGTLFLALRSPRAVPAVTTSAPSSSLAIAAAPPPSAPPSAFASAPAAADPLARHLVVALPFLALRVTVDGAAHDMSPAADVLSLELPEGSDTLHHVVATALDGTQAEADMLERDGVAQAVGAGFHVMTPEAPSGISVPRRRPPARPGVVRNGFTKLK